MKRKEANKDGKRECKVNSNTSLYDRHNLPFTSFWTGKILQIQNLPVSTGSFQRFSVRTDRQTPVQHQDYILTLNIIIIIGKTALSWPQPSL
jgi:hypothetical protein